MKLFLANCEKIGIEEFYKSKYYLESFYYLKYDFQIQMMNKCDMFLLDSGAFTFMNTKTKNVGNIDDYLTAYIEFINKHDVKYFFELDTDVVHGLSKVEQMRNRLERETGKQCIPVWHKSRGIEYWKMLCERYKYIAIGGFVTKEIKPFEYDNAIKMVKYAIQKNVKVHGLGFTSMKYLSKFPFYSVDSTSYKSGKRFGQFHHFDGKRIVSRKRPEGFRVKKYADLDLINLRAWIEFQKYAERCL